MRNVDVIIPYHNNAATLQRLLDSIPEDMGIIIVDDASDIPLSSERGIVYRFNENRGVSAARNYGLEKSGAEYIVFADADDEFIGLGDIAELQADVVAYGVEMIHDDGSPEVLPAAVRIRVSAICCGVLFRREWLNEHSIRFLPELKFLEDGVLIDIVRRMTSIGQCRIEYAQQTIYRHIANPNGTTHTQPEHGIPQGILRDTLHAKSREYEYLRETLPQCMGENFRRADTGSLYYHYLTSSFAGYSKEDLQRMVRVLSDIYGDLSVSEDIQEYRRNEAAMIAEQFTEQPYDEWLSDIRKE